MVSSLLFPHLKDAARSVVSNLNNTVLSKVWETLCLFQNMADQGIPKSVQGLYVTNNVSEALT